MSNLDPSSEGETLSLYDEEVPSDQEVDLNDEELLEVAGGVEVLPSDLPPAPTPSKAPSAVGLREVMPSQLPPAAAPEAPRESQERVKSGQPAKPEEPAKAEKSTKPEESAKPEQTAKPAKPASKVKVAALEALASEGQWTKVCVMLGAPENKGKLPARLALIYAIALNEVRVPGASSDKRAPDIERFARQSLAVLLQLDPKSPLVHMAVKRLMRRSWRAAPAPPTRTSVLLIIAAIMLGAFVGFLLGPGKDWFKHM